MAPLRGKGFDQAGSSTALCVLHSVTLIEAPCDGCLRADKPIWKEYNK